MKNNIFKLCLLSILTMSCIHENDPHGNISDPNVGTFIATRKITRDSNNVILADSILPGTDTISVFSNGFIKWRYNIGTDTIVFSSYIKSNDTIRIYPDSLRDGNGWVAPYNPTTFRFTGLNVLYISIYWMGIITIEQQNQNETIWKIHEINSWKYSLEITQRRINSTPMDFQ